MMKWGCLVLGATLFLAPCCGSAAEGTALDEVNGIGARTPEKLRETPVSVGMITTGEVDAAGYRNPAELFSRLPGITTAGFAGEDALTAVRLPPMPANQETVIFVDGLPSFTWGRGSGDFWKYFNGRDIDRIELLRGPSSPLYGSGAVGGTINVLTKTPPATPEIGVWGEYGRNDRWRGGVSGGARVGQFAGNLNLNVDFSDGWREHSRVEKEAATGNVQYFLDDVSTLRLRVDFVHAHNNLPGMLDETVFFTNPKQSNNTFAVDRIDRITPTLTYDRKIGDAGRLNLALQVQSNTSDNFVDPKNFMFVSNPERQYQGITSYLSSLDVDVQARYAHDLKGLRTRIMGGVDYSHSDQQSESTNFQLGLNGSQFTNERKATKYDSFDIAVDAVAPYLQVEVSPVERLRVLVDGRYDVVRYDATGKTNQSRHKDGSADFNEFTFRAGAAYDILPELNLFANFSQGFTAPTAEQLYAAPSYDTNGTAAGLKSAANRNLNAERSHGYEVGARSAFWNRRAMFDVAYFDQTVSDRIVQNLIVGDPTVPYQNGAKATSRGVELQTTLLPHEMVRTRFAYTYARSTCDTFFGVGGSFLPRAPEHHLNARVALLPVKGLEVELEVDEITKQYADDANTLSYSRPTLVNLRARYVWENWSFWAHLLNLTNQSYATYVTRSTTATTTAASYYPGDPLTFCLGVAYTWR